MQNNILVASQIIGDIIYNYIENNDKNKDILIEALPSLKLDTTKIIVSHNSKKILFPDIDIKEVQKYIKLLETYLKNNKHLESLIKVSFIDSYGFILKCDGLIKQKIKVK